MKSWLAFAIQKLDELRILGQALTQGRDSVRSALDATQGTPSTKEEKPSSFVAQLLLSDQFFDSFSIFLTDSVRMGYVILFWSWGYCRSFFQVSDAGGGVGWFWLNASQMFGIYHSVHPQLNP